MQHARIQELTKSTLLGKKKIRLLGRNAVGGVGLATYKEEKKMHKNLDRETRRKEKKIDKVLGGRGYI